MSYFGKEFTLASQENFEAFLDAFGDKIPAEMKKVVVNHKGTVKLLKNGEEYTLVTSKPTGGLKEVTFKSGVQFDDELGGNKAKTTNTMDGNTLTTVMKFENGEDFTAKREFSDSEQVVTINASIGASAKRIYKA